MRTPSLRDRHAVGTVSPYDNAHGPYAASPSIDPVTSEPPPTVDALCELLASLAQHAYGEDLDVLAHSLQTAAHAERSGAADDLVVAALFHDVGHGLGDPTEWGVLDHSTTGARYLARWFGPTITEPVRLHVQAKRYLVATDSGYRNRLSRASLESLRLQGGPFDEDHAARFARERFAADAVTLRRWDDAGKVPDDEVPPIEHYRPLIEAAVV